MHHLLTRLAPVAAAFALCATLAAPAFAQSLPPVPEYIKKQGVLRAGVKCDYPPDGFMDQSGKPVGVEIDVVRQIAKYAFGSPDRLDTTCVTAANRIPALVGGKIDLIMATLGINAERAKVVDFSEPYAWGGSDVLVPEASPIKSLDDFKGKTVIVLKGAWQIGWFEKNLPEVKLLKLDSVSDGLQALLQGRGQGYAHDLAVLMGIAKKNPRVRLVGELYQLGYRGVGMRKDEKEWVAFVNAAIAQAKKDGIVTAAVRKYAEPDLVDAVLASWDLSKVPAKSR